MKKRIESTNFLEKKSEIGLVEQENFCEFGFSS